MRRSIQTFLTILVSIISFTTFAQDAAPKKHKFDAYFHWGYNRAQYGKSDIHFKGGNDFNFILHDVKANDVPEKYNSKAYLNPAFFTIPQFNFRIGVKMDNKWAFSFGWDHLKYRIVRNQNVGITGFIGAVGGDYSGDYSDGKPHSVNVAHNFLEMEHTDGLNYIHLNADRIMKVYEKGIFRAELVAGLGTGPVCPWTDTRLFNTFYRNPSIHFAGWGLSVNAAPRVTLFNRFFVEGLFRVGHIQLWDIMVIRNKYTAGQKINYYEHNITAGFFFPLNPSKNGTDQPKLDPAR